MALNPANFTLNTTSGFVDVPFAAIPIPSDIAAIKTHTWAWGDGSISQSVRASHEYTVPGTYEIHHIASAYNGSTYTATQSVTANAWLEDTVKMEWGTPTIIAGIPSALTISITSRDVPEKIILHYDNSGSSNPSLAQTNPLKYWDHLVPKWSFTEPGDSDNAIISPVVTSYAIYVNDALVGWNSQTIVDFTDQMPCTQGTVWATLSYGPTVNSRVYAASSVRVDALLIDSTHTSLRISRDGISDFGVAQYSGVAIPYVTTIVDSRLPGLGIMHYTYNGSSPTLYITTLTADQYTIAPFTMQSVIVCGASSTHTTHIVTAANTTDNAYVLGTVLLPTSATSITLTARENFTVAAFKDGNQLRRFNEEFSFADILKQYAPYHIVEKAPFFFGTYINAIFGDGVSGTPQDIGIKTYEKIANFVQNHGDIDTCNIAQLVSNAIMTGVPINKIAHQLPDDFKRMLDIISVPFSRVAPTSCACNRTFKDCAACCDNGLLCKLCKLDKRGNRGQQLNCATYTVSAGTSIVYYSKTLNTYNLLYTVPVSSGSVSSYAVADIDYSGMIQPICDNYVLYEYLPTPSLNPIESIINWSSTNTNAVSSMTYAEWTAEGGIMEQIIRYHLIKGTNAYTTVETSDAYPAWNTYTPDWSTYQTAEISRLASFEVPDLTFTFVPVTSGFSSETLVAAPNGWVYAFNGSSVSAVDAWYKINSYTHEVREVLRPAMNIFGNPILANNGSIYITNSQGVYKLDTLTDTLTLVNSSTAESWELYLASPSIGEKIYYFSNYGSPFIPKYFNTTTNSIHPLTSDTAFTHSRTTFLAPNGNVYAAPYRKKRRIIKVDPATNAISEIGPTFSIPVTGTDPFYIGAKTVADGTTYCFSTNPSLANQNILNFSSITETVTSIALPSSAIFLWSSVGYLDNNIYLIGRKAIGSPYITKFDSASHAISEITVPFPTEIGFSRMVMSHTGQLVIATNAIGLPSNQKGFWFVFSPTPNVDINRVLSKYTSQG